MEDTRAKYSRSRLAKYAKRTFENSLLKVAKLSRCIVFRVWPCEICGGLAQLGERLLCTQEVSGSIPLISTSYGSLAQSVRALA